jgi:hypothetical protein
LCFVGTALMENRNGLVVDGRLTRASGVSECLAGIDLADAHIRQGGTLAGDKGFDTADFVAELRDRRITPHVAQNAYDTGPELPGGEATVQYRRTDDPPRRLCGEPEMPQAHRGNLRPAMVS